MNADGMDGPGCAPNRLSPYMSAAGVRSISRQVGENSGDGKSAIGNMSGGTGSGASAILGSAGSMYREIIHLSAGRLAHLNSSPPELIPPPGPGKALLYVTGAVQTIFHTTSFASVSPRVYYTNDIPGGNFGRVNNGWENQLWEASSRFVMDATNEPFGSIAPVVNSGFSLFDENPDDSTPGADTEVYYTIFYETIRIF